MGEPVVEPSVPPTETKQEEEAKPRRGGGDDDIKCTVCMGSEYSQECRVDGCKHSFCFPCISEWVCQAVRPSCPMCRKDVDKVSYDFRNDDDGRMEVFIKEYRSSQMSLSPTDRAQMMGERRLVVRNLVYAYKLKAQLASAIEEHEEAAESDEALKKSLMTLLEDVSLHLEKSEPLLISLRTELVQNDKALACNTESFRRMVYTLKIKVKYPDLRRPKLLPSDVAQKPERFRAFITQFLVSEFESIPTHIQPNPGGFRWRTKFLGSAIDEAKKKEFADEIYELMMVTRPGNEIFQKMLSEILPNVDPNHITILDDHLEAILSVESTNYNEFYNQIYYDSVYNTYTNNFELQGMMNAMRAMRGIEGEGNPIPFETFFNRYRSDDWGTAEHFLDERLIRQMSNTDRTDNATNNDDSDGSGSPEERVPTPMPDDDMLEESFSNPDVEDSLALYRLYTRDHGLQHERALESLRMGSVRATIPSREPVNRGPTVRRDERSRRDDVFARRLRELDARSEAIANMIRPPPILGNPSDPTGRRRLITFNAAPNSLTTTTSTVPVYLPSTASSQHVVPPPHLRHLHIAPAVRLNVQRELNQMTEMLNSRVNRPPSPPQPVLSQAGHRRLQDFIEDRMREARGGVPHNPTDAATSMQSRVNPNGSTTINYRSGNMNASLTTRLPPSFFATDRNVPVPNIRLGRPSTARDGAETRSRSHRVIPPSLPNTRASSGRSNRMRNRAYNRLSRNSPSPMSSGESSREADQSNQGSEPEPEPTPDASTLSGIPPRRRRRPHRTLPPYNPQLVSVATFPRRRDFLEPSTSEADATTTPESTNEERERRDLADIAASIDRADADAGLDFISVAHRTRAARRAAANGQLPGSPAVKRTSNSRRE